MITVRKIIENNIGYIFLIAFIVISPLVIAGLITISNFGPGNDGDWIQFWGGYFGSIIGGIFTFVGVKITIKNELRHVLTLIRFQTR